MRVCATHMYAGNEEAGMKYQGCVCVQHSSTSECALYRVCLFGLTAQLDEDMMLHGICVKKEHEEAHT